MAGQSVTGVVFDGFGNFSGLEFNDKSDKAEGMMQSKVQDIPVSGAVSLVGLRSIKKCDGAGQIKAVQLILMGQDSRTCA